MASQLSEICSMASQLLVFPYVTTEPLPVAVHIIAR